MNLSAVLEAATLVAFVVVLVMAGGGGGGGDGGGGEGQRRRDRGVNSRRGESTSRRQAIGGGGGKEKEGWKVLAWMIGVVSVGEGLAGGLVVSYSRHFLSLFLCLGMVMMGDSSETDGGEMVTMECGYWDVLL